MGAPTVVRYPSVWYRSGYTCYRAGSQCCQCKKAFPCLGKVFVTVVWRSLHDEVAYLCAGRQDPYLSRSDCEYDFLCTAQQTTYGMDFPHLVTFTTSIRETLGLPVSNQSGRNPFRGLSRSPSRFLRVDLASYSCFASDEWLASFLREHELKQREASE